MNSEIALGIDISKETFDACIVIKGKERHRAFKNTAKGFEQLCAWLRSFNMTRVHACMEASGGYENALAERLHAQGHIVSVVNPSRIKGHAMTQTRRHKNDKIDASLNRSFCETHRPDAWQPPDAKFKELRDLVRLLDGEVEAQAQCKIRLQSPMLTEPMRVHLQRELQFRAAQIAQLQHDIKAHLQSNPDLAHQRDLLTTIPGIGEVTALRFIAELMDVKRFDCAGACAAALGVTPRHHTSGTSVKPPSRISKMGNARLRSAFWWPTIRAMQINPIVQAFIKRIRLTHPVNKVCILAAMHKLVAIAYGVIKNNAPFDPDWHKNSA